MPWENKTEILILEEEGGKMAASHLLLHEELRHRNEHCANSHDQAARSDDFRPVKSGTKVANKCDDQEIPFGGKKRDSWSRKQPAAEVNTCAHTLNEASL